MPPASSAAIGRLRRHDDGLPEIDGTDRLRGLHGAGRATASSAALERRPGDVPCGRQQLRRNLMHADQLAALRLAVEQDHAGQADIAQPARELARQPEGVGEAPAVACRRGERHRPAPDAIGPKALIGRDSAAASLSDCRVNWSRGDRLAAADEVDHLQRVAALADRARHVRDEVTTVPRRG